MYDNDNADGRAHDGPTRERDDWPAMAELTTWQRGYRFGRRAFVTDTAVFGARWVADEAARLVREYRSGGPPNALGLPEQERAAWRNGWLIGYRTAVGVDGAQFAALARARRGGRRP